MVSVLMKIALFSFLVLNFFASGEVLHAQPVISSVEISGYSYFNTNEIVNMMVSKKDRQFDPTQFNLDLTTIRDKYKSSGFLFVKFKENEAIYNRDSSAVDLKIEIDEGDRIVIGDIQIAGNTLIRTNELLENFHTGKDQVLNDHELNRDISKILKMYEDRGNLFAKAIVRDISVYRDNNEPKLRITIEIMENSNIEIDQVKITGNETTEDYVILREIKLEKNKRISVETLRDIKQRLERLNIFEYVSEPKVYTLKNKTESGLLIEVREGNNNTFDGVLGYIPPANENESGYFTGLVNVSLRNLFGTGRKLEAIYRQEVKETQDLSFRYMEPYILGYPVNLLFGFRQRIQDTTYTKRNIDLKADVNITDRFTLSGTGSFERIIPSDIPSPNFLIADSRTLSSGIEIKYDSRNNVFIPTSGILYSTFYSYGSKNIFNIESFHDPGIRDNYSIQKYWVDLEFYHSFFRRQSSMVKLFGGEIRSDRLEDSDFFRVGGMANIRGYRDEQFLASRLAYGNFELRYAISEKSFLFGFFDPGYYVKPEDTVNILPEQKGFLYGYGTGLRLETQLGLIGVSYALGKGDSFLDGKIHFGLINNF
jgi:outer membrane protein insertion porin family